MNTHLNFIGNRWIASQSGKLFDNENPAHKGTMLARFQASSAEDILAAVNGAAQGFQTWKQVPLAERQAKVRRFLELLGAAREELARIVTEENGKTLGEARGEVDSALVEGNYHLHQVSALTGHTLPLGDGDITGWVQYEPLGVIGIISPWNYPVNVMCRKTLPALLTGNTVVFKPASFTPWSGVFMAGLFERAGFPSGVFNCVTGPGSALGNALIDDARVRAVSFTGSTEVGKKIQARAVQNLTRTQLELGGKNALIVMADADQPLALDAIMRAGFGCAGQWCTSTSRVLIQRSIYRSFADQLTAKAEQVVLGDPLDEKTGMGPVAGPDQYANIGRAIDLARQEGARMATGGRLTGTLGDQGYFIRPTIFLDVTPAMTLFREEVFGPVLALTPFNTLDEALRLANDSPYGLSSGIFTKDLAAARRYIREVRTGMVHVNIHTGFKDPSLPFGGWKESGFGLPENSRTGLEFFLDRKAVYLRGLA